MPKGSPPIRAAVVGARRRRVGTGPFLARHLSRAGAEVVGIVGTTPGTVAEARADLARDGLEPVGYLDVRELLEALAPDVLVIASPPEAHGEALEAALAARCHVLCEKPLLGGEGDLGATAQRFAAAFHAAGLHLAVSAQWPYTLAAYRELHPGVLDRVPDTFTMALSPSKQGRAMIADALPHALSLLYAVSPDPGGRIEDVRFRVAGSTRVDLTFRYATRDHEIQCAVDLRHVAAPPRRAAFGFDGCVVDRTIEEPGYRLGLRSADARAWMPDPLEALVGDFVGRVSSGRAPERDRNAYPGPVHLARIEAAWPDREESPDA